VSSIFSVFSVLEQFGKSFSTETTEKIEDTEKANLSSGRAEI